MPYVVGVDDEYLSIHVHENVFSGDEAGIAARTRIRHDNCRNHESLALVILVRYS